MINPLGWKTSLTGSFLSVLVIFVAYNYKRQADEMLQDRMNQILSGLLRAEKKVPLAPGRVAFGFGGCEDLFVNAMEIVNRLNLTAPEGPQHYFAVHNATEFAELFAFFFQHGAAAERYVANESLFERLVECGEASPNHHYILGGNAPVMARRMALEGFHVLLGARMSPDVAASLPDKVQVVGEPVKKSDIHLILEYAKGERWGQYQASRANRLILHNDKVNPYLSGLEDFAQELQHFKPNLVVVGGLQMMDNFPYKQNERLDRLKKLQSVLESLPATSRVHFEMASFTDETLLQEIMDTVVAHSDSLGMNEQELPNLVSLLENGNVTILSDSHPRVASVLDQMRTVYSILSQTPPAGGRRKLTRLHVHTLAFQAILTTRSSAWKNTMSASAKAALMAHRHVCGSHRIDLMKTKILLDDSFAASQSGASGRIRLVDNRPVSCWEEDDYQLCVAPGLVCTQVRQTAGGGDNISSAGLVLQI
ncbi:hypothetical protein ACOMHN_024422 [Nucella lapillus]